MGGEREETERLREAGRQSLSFHWIWPSSIVPFSSTESKSAAFGRKRKSFFSPLLDSEEAEVDGGGQRRRVRKGSADRRGQYI